MESKNKTGSNHSLVSSFFGLVIVSIIGVSYAAIPCPTLSLLPGTVVECDLPKENRAVNCTDENSEITRGTVAKYKCERDTDFSGNILKCGCKGRWRGLQMFNDFMSNCNISDYSLEGPAELNLTETEIQQLALPAPEEANTTDFQEDGVAYHNLYRNIHHSPSLKLNQTLSDAAQKWADEQVDQASLKTQDWSDRWYSQNLYRVRGNGIDAREAVRLAVAAWYQGAYHYDWENPSGQSAFTQVVWKSTTDLGIGVAQRGNQTVVVADYYPPGNVVVNNPSIEDKWAWFRVNVFPPNMVPENAPMQSSSGTSSTQTSSISSTSTSAPTMPIETTEHSTMITTTTTTESATTLH